MDNPLTITAKSPPACGPAESGVVELTGVTCQADRSDIVSEVDGAAKLHQGNVVVICGAVEARMYDDLGHCAPHLVGIGARLSVSSKVECPHARYVPKYKNKLKLIKLVRMLHDNLKCPQCL